MRRIMLLVTVGLVMAAVMAIPARADEPDHPGDCHFERGKTYCTERERIDDVTEEIDEVEYEVECARPGEPSQLEYVLEETYRTYEVYRITETTYAGKSEHVLDRNTRTERGLYHDYVLTTGGCLED
jgi:hypothetical protein